MDAREQTRVRENGTVVTNSENFVDPGLARIVALRGIVNGSQYQKIDGQMVDLFSASAIIKVYDAINEQNRVKFRGLPVGRMANIAFSLLK